MQRRMLYGALSIPAALAAAAAVLAALLQSGYFRDRLIGYAADQTG